MDDTRFNEILGILHANLADDLKLLAQQIDANPTEVQDVSDYGGDSVMLAGANVDWREIHGFANAFAERFGMPESPRSAKFRLEQERATALAQLKQKALAKLSPQDREVPGLSRQGCTGSRPR